MIRTHRFTLLAGSILMGFLLSEAVLRASCYVRNRYASHAPTSQAFDIFVVGESTTAGYPFHFNSDISFPDIVMHMFHNTLQGRRIQLHMLAVPGDSAFPQAFKLRKTLYGRDPSRPGLVLVYSGQNEGFLEKMPKTPWWQKGRSALCAHSFAASTLFTFLENKKYIKRIRSLEYYELNLRQIIDDSLRSGVTPLLSTVVSNVADIEPGLFGTGPLTPAQFFEIIHHGEQLAKMGQGQKAIDYYHQQSQTYPKIANYLTFRIGKCYEQIKHYEAARRAYEEANNSNAIDNFSRATRLQNELLRRLARIYRIPLVEAVGLFEARSPHGLLGNTLFMDGQHPNLAGTLVLAQGFSKAISDFTEDPVGKEAWSPDALLQMYAYDRSRQVLPHLISSKWLFIMSRRHHYPRWRLALAADHCRQALELDPHCFSAWLLGGFIEAAMQKNILLEENELKRIASYGLFDFNIAEYNPSKEQLQIILETFKSCRVNPRILQEIKARLN